MSEKQYPLHHDHGTVTISRDVFESMTAELERLRPMECGLELAEADRDAYKKKVEELKEGAKNLILDNYLQDKEIRRHKHKRCLAMAKWCRLHDEFTQLESERLGLPHRAIFMEYRRKAMWWNKWHKRWLELAEKFKTNSTAQHGKG